MSAELNHAFKIPTLLAVWGATLGDFKEFHL